MKKYLILTAIDTSSYPPSVESYIIPLKKEKDGEYANYHIKRFLTKPNYDKLVQLIKYYLVAHFILEESNIEEAINYLFKEFEYNSESFCLNLQVTEVGL